jgi:RNA-directed DNA polymerase
MPAEGRDPRGGEPREGTRAGTQKSGDLYPKLERVARLAKEQPGTRFTSLAHLMDEELLREAWRRIRKDGAVGIDGQTAKAYEEGLEERLHHLHERLRSRRYVAPPVRRVYIPKDDGRQRPLGIPTVEDKVVQKAVAMLLEAVHEQDFLDCSYGFRPGRSAHQALQALQSTITLRPIGWVLDADVENFFGNVNHMWLRKMVWHRVNDGALNQLIGKWLHAGVMERGEYQRTDRGTPQGGVISPLLANIYLHYVLDLWFEKRVRRKLRGEAYLYRYADDVLMCFEREDDARQVAEQLRERLAQYDLKLNEAKTRLIRFGRGAQGPDGGRPETFDFLGFTHYCGKSRTGKFIVKRRTMGKRLSRAMRRVTTWCREHRHWPVVEQARHLNAVLRGHYGYYGITGNYQRLNQYYEHVRKTWRKWLGRRGKKGSMPWTRYTQLLQSWPLLRPRIVHSVYAC